MAKKEELCPCGSGAAFADCCEPFISGAKQATTAEQLMRSRYSAYVKVAADYLYDTTHPNHRQGYDHEGTKKWAESAEWQGLEIVASSGGPDDLVGQVEFKARYAESGEDKEHHELGQFKKLDGRWLFTEGKMGGRQPITSTKVGRNDPCPCGSNQKYKKCCGK
jgi:SEC-C motif-containing protein